MAWGTQIKERIQTVLTGGKANPLMQASHWFRKQSVSMQEAGLLPLPLGQVRAGRAMGGIENWGKGIRGLVGEGNLRGHGSHRAFLSRRESL